LDTPFGPGSFGLGVENVEDFGSGREEGFDGEQVVFPWHGLYIVKSYPADGDRGRGD
jgi:hypothetical protein